MKFLLLVLSWKYDVAGLDKLVDRFTRRVNSYQASWLKSVNGVADFE